jgi:hypothetical protein
MPDFIPAKSAPTAGEPQPAILPPDAPPPVEKPDPKQVEAYLAETWAHVVGLVEQVVGTLPQLHGLAGRAAAMRASFDAALFHAGPPPEAPPPSYEALPFGATRQEIEDRVKMLEALPRLSDEQTVELARLKSTL